MLRRFLLSRLCKLSCFLTALKKAPSFSIQAPTKLHSCKLPPRRPLQAYPKQETTTTLTLLLLLLLLLPHTLSVEPYQTCTFRHCLCLYTRAHTDRDTSCRLNHRDTHQPTNQPTLVLDRREHQLTHPRYLVTTPAISKPPPPRPPRGQRWHLAPTKLPLLARSTSSPYPPSPSLIINATQPWLSIKPPNPPPPIHTPTPHKTQPFLSLCVCVSLSLLCSAD